MNYENMTDFDINKAVATSWLECDYDFDDDGEAVDLVGYQTYLGAHGIPDERLEIYGEFNPLNNVGDAWSIILENKINLLWDTESTKWEAQAVVTIDMYEPPTCKYYYYDKNPLRAAMIVYLMMNEDK